MASAMRSASSPDTRTMPIPPAPIGDEIAAIVLIFVSFRNVSELLFAAETLEFGRACLRNGFYEIVLLGVVSAIHSSVRSFDFFFS